MEMAVLAERDNQSWRELGTLTPTWGWYNGWTCTRQIRILQRWRKSGLHVTQEKPLGRLKAGFPTLKGKGPSLLRRNWLSAIKLKWQQIFKVEVNCTLQGVLSCFSAVFKEDLGTVQGVKARIHVNPQASPIFYIARTVPFVLRDKVETNLDWLLSVYHWTCEILQLGCTNCATAKRR